jgi:hypothetical protein
VLLLDGFDELQRQNDTAEEERLFSQIKALTQYEYVIVILSSRSTAFINSPHLLNIPTIYVNDYDEHQVGLWIDNWKRINKDKATTISIEGLKERNLIDICRNKLILYMVARIYDDELHDTKKYTKAYVYKCFFDWTIDGKFKEDIEYTSDRYSGSKSYSRETYRRILQDIALVISQFSTNEIISVKQLEGEMSKFQREELNSEIFDFTTHLFTRHFFSTQKNENQMYIEFSHKSLREYIYAEKIFCYLINLCDNTSSSTSLGVWYQFGRNQRLSKEVFEFLEELLAELSVDELIKVGEKMYNFAIVLLIGDGRFRRYIEGISNREKAIINISESFYRSLVLSVIAGITNHICYNLVREKSAECADTIKLVSCEAIYKICDYYMGTAKSYFAMYPVFLQFVKHIRINDKDIANAQYTAMNLQSFEIIDGMLFRGIIQNSVIDRVNWLSTDFSIMKFDHVVISSGTIDSCSFEYCKFNDVVFRNVFFKDVNFETLREGAVRFEKCTFLDTTVEHYLPQDGSNFLDLRSIISRDEQERDLG